MKVNKEDVIYEVARELGKDKELITFVVSNFWKTISYLLRNPMIHYRHIMISEFGKFYVNYYTLNRKLETLKREAPTSPYIEVYEKMIENNG